MAEWGENNGERTKSGEQGSLRKLAAAVAQGPLTPEQQIEWNEIHWPMLAAEPRGVDYIEVDSAGIHAMWIIPKGSAEDRVIFYAHGGGFVSGSMYTHRKMVGHLAKAVGWRALTFDYPYAHQRKYPARLDVTVTFGLFQRARHEGFPLPVAAMIVSGRLDMALTGASYETNREKDVFYTREGVEWLVTSFLGKGDRRDPLVSALYANPEGFPPIFLQAGADETLVDESRMFAERARAAGVDVRIDVFLDSRDASHFPDDGRSGSRSRRCDSSVR
jgi:epsilon-lactone hydrolase